MHVNKLIVETMKICTEFAAKSYDVSLTEYEALAFEQMCRMLESFARIQSLTFEHLALSQEKELYQERCNHEKWLKDFEKGEDDDLAADESTAA